MSINVKPKQLKAIYMLMEGMNSREIAKKLKLRAETLSRWKKRPEFIVEYEKVKMEAWEKLEYRWQSVAENAVTAIASELCYHECNPKRIEMALKMLEIVGIDLKAMSIRPHHATIKKETVV